MYLPPTSEAGDHFFFWEKLSLHALETEHAWVKAQLTATPADLVDFVSEVAVELGDLLAYCTWSGNQDAGGDLSRNRSDCAQIARPTFDQKLGAQGFLPCEAGEVRGRLEAGASRSTSRGPSTAASGGRTWRAWGWRSSSTSTPATPGWTGRPPPPASRSASWTPTSRSASPASPRPSAPSPGSTPSPPPCPSSKLGPQVNLRGTEIELMPGEAADACLEDVPRRFLNHHYPYTDTLCRFECVFAVRSGRGEPWQMDDGGDEGRWQRTMEECGCVPVVPIDFLADPEAHPRCMSLQQLFCLRPLFFEGSPCPWPTFGEE